MTNRRASSGQRGGSNRASRISTLLRNAERGEDAGFEFTYMVLPMAMMITLIAAVTLVRSSQLPLWTAATECARAAVATLDESIGTRQGEEAGMNSLLGNGISAASVPSVDITLGPDGWARGKPLTCEVRYTINTGGVPGFSNKFPTGIPMSASVTLPIDPWKSQWDPALP